MARIRSIKPEFWTAEQVMELTRDARLLFIGLWNFCDDAGIHPASTKTLKAEVFPADDLTSADVRRMIDECIKQDLLIEYEIDGRSYWQITGWHHQKIDQPTYKHPSPDGKVPVGAAKRRSEKLKESMQQQENFAEHSPNTSRTFAEHSPNTSRTFAECSPPETRRDETSGEEYKSVVVSASARPRERASAVCVAIRSEGVSSSNPQHPDLLALLADGAEIQEFVDAARLAKARGKGFAYVIGIVKGQRADARRRAAEAKADPPSRNGRPEKFDPVAYVNRNRISTQRNGNAPDQNVIDITPERLA